MDGVRLFILNNDNVSRQRVSRYPHEVGFRWHQREPILETDKKGQLKLIMKRLPVMVMLQSLLAHAPGRQIRRSANGGIYCPKPIENNFARILVIGPKF